VADGLKIVNNSEPGKEKIMNSLRMSWIKKQQYLTSRNDQIRYTMRERLLASSPEEKVLFMNAYRKNNLWLLPYWRLIGVNAHTALIIAFMAIGRFDIYVVAFDIVILNLIILIVGFMQKNQTRNFF